MTYTQSEIPTVISTNGSNDGMWGSDGIWAILLLALLGNNGFGFGGRGGYGGGFGAGNEFVGYELGKVATQADVASGFNNSAVLGSLNDIKLGQAQMQNWINQGFVGVDRTALQGFNSIENSICTLGYQQSQLVNGLSRELADCCCSTKQAIADLKYSNERQTCDLIVNQNANTQKIIDYMQNEKIASLQAENVALKGRISNDQQSAYIIDRLSPCPRPAYVVPNPNCCYTACGGNGTSVI
jgi:hypothetical protein